MVPVLLLRVEASTNGARMSIKRQILQMERLLGVWAIKSFTREDWYVVKEMKADIGSIFDCSCPHQTKTGRMCKHIAAVIANTNR